MDRKRTPLLHKFTYIYWSKEASIINKKYEEFKQIYNSLDITKKVKTKTVRKLFGIGCWRYEKKGDWGRIYIHNDIADYRIYVCNLFDDNKNNQEPIFEHMTNTGRKALKLIKDKFKENEKITFHRAFGTVEKEFLRCVPSQFTFKSNYKGIMDNISVVDYCSQYPYCMTGKLPNSSTAIKLKGTIKPNEEYPFAFYLNSGHIAEYNVFDTHDWNNSVFEYELFKKSKNELNQKHRSIKEENDVTILMKASQYTLTSIYKELYDSRKTDENAKLNMIASIGQMHTKTYKGDKYAHLAAICIARANNRVLKIAEQIGIHNIIQLVVDGIIYRGCKKYGQDEKEFGALHQEYLFKSINYENFNRYIISEFKNYNNVKDFKHAGCNYTRDLIPLDSYIPPNIYDINNWMLRTKENLLYEEES